MFPEKLADSQSQFPNTRATLTDCPGKDVLYAPGVSTPDKRGNRKSEVLVPDLSGNPTYQDLTAWSVDNFRFADQPDTIARSSSKNHHVSLVVQLSRMVLGSTDDKDLSRKTHPAVCGVPTQSFERLTPHFS